MLKRSLVTLIGGVIAAGAAHAAPGPVSAGITEIKRVLPPERALSLHERRSVEVFVELTDPSVVELVNRERRSRGARVSAAGQRDHAAMLRRKQESLELSLRAMGARPMGRLRMGANGLKMRVYNDQLAAIRGLPGVKAVTPLVQFRPALEHSVPWIGADAAHALGFDGTGMTIAVIDTGIDYLHQSFGGSGEPGDYADNDPSSVEPGTFPTAKVIGGYDFAGANYDAAGVHGSAEPVPDPDPFDYVGHGTHVASTAAGQAAGQVAAGVAPGAKLLAVKVFGDVDSSSTLVVDGIEYALDPNGDGDLSDRADVINLSLGSDFGQPGDPTSIAASNAAELGVIVVAAAGNAGNGIPYVLGSPAASPDTIAVASSLAGGVPAFFVGFEGAPRELVKAEYSDISPPLAQLGSVSGPLVAAEPLEACAPLGNDLSGAVAFIARGTCTFTEKLQYALDAGAVAAVVMNNVDGGPIVMGGESNVALPAAMIDLNAGRELLDALDAGADISAELSEANLLPYPDDDDTISEFSSSGPSAVTNGFKPDLTAPGGLITAAAAGSGDGGVARSGTSMASPHVAGAAAILKQKFADLTPAQIKSLLQNSTQPLRQGGPAGDSFYRLSLQGTGRVQVARALELTSLARPGGVSFGRLNPLTPMRAQQIIEVENLTDSPRTFRVMLEPNTSVVGVNLSAPGQIEVPPNGSAQLSLNLALDPSSLSGDDGLFSQREVDGWVVLSDDIDTLRVGYVSVVDPASAILNFGRPRELQYLLNWAGNLGFAEGFTLLGEDGDQLNDKPNAIDAFGFRTGYLNGVAAIEFGLAGEIPWNTFSNYYVALSVDGDQDGQPEYVVYAADMGTLIGEDPTGEIVTAILNLDTEELIGAYRALTDYNDRWLIFATDQYGDYGILPRGDTRFDYLLEFGDLSTGEFDAQTGTVDFQRELIVDQNSFVLDDHRARRVSPLLVEEGARYMWLLPNNRAADQLIVN